MKSNDKLTTTTLRSLINLINNKAINKKIPTSNITNDLTVECINQAIKQREESINQFKLDNRQDLINIEQAELNILKLYQPKQLSELELIPIIQNIINQTNTNNFSILMKSIMNELKGKADSKLINNLSKFIIENITN